MITLTRATRTSIDGTRNMELYTAITLAPGGGGALVVRALPVSRAPYNTVLVIEFSTDDELRELADQIQAALNRR